MKRMFISQFPIHFSVELELAITDDVVKAVRDGIAGVVAGMLAIAAMADTVGCAMLERVAAFFPILDLKCPKCGHKGLP
jgi:hypothetical protein